MTLVETPQAAYSPNFAAGGDNAITVRNRIHQTSSASPWALRRSLRQNRNQLSSRRNNKNALCAVPHPELLVLYPALSYTHMCILHLRMCVRRIPNSQLYLRLARFGFRPPG